MAWFDDLSPAEVGNRARHFQNAIVGARAEALLYHGPLQQVLRIGAQFAVLPDLTRTHLSVGVHVFPAGAEAVQLRVPGTDNTAANVGRTFRHDAAAQLAVVHRGHVDVDINAVEQRAGDLRNIALDHHRRAVALARAVAEVAAGTWIHGRHQHEARRETERHGGARDGYRAVLKRLSVLQPSPPTLRIANVQILYP